MAKLKTGRHTGALKAQRQAEKRTSQNKGLMKKVRENTKKVLAAVKAESATVAEDLKLAASSIDKAAKKKTIHWKTAARKKSRLAKAANKAAAKPAAKAAAKPAAKKTAAKKAPAKKTAAKAK